MANPTTYYGWVMPAATDLVTDLPADFNVFGQGVDTSMSQLLGGTTGQVLAKTSATNMAFTWTTPQVGDITEVAAGTGISGGGTSGSVTVTNSMATAITTAGDIIRGTGSGTFSRLGIGTASQVLAVNSGATAPEWVTPATGSLVLVKSQVIGTGVSSVAVTNAFSSAYDAYKIIIGGTGVGSTVGEVLTLQLGATTTNYDSANFQVAYSGSATFAAGTSGGTAFQRVGAIKTTYVQMNLDLLNPFNAANTFIQGFYDYYTDGGFFTGIQRSTTSFTGFSIIPAGGTMTGGTIYVYGYKNT